MRWRTDQLAAIDAVLRSARAGRPAFASIIGEAGAGKTSLLGELANKATGFSVVSGAAHDLSYRRPYGSLLELGIDVVGADAGSTLDPLIASQWLRELVDDRLPRGPVLLILDDAQWADRESLEAVYWLLQRASGDRFAVVVASRPPASGDSILRALHGAATDDVSITVDELTYDQAEDMVRSFDADAPEGLARKLWNHTGGRALYLRSLLRQHGAEALERMREYPAPRELIDELETRLAGASPDALAVLRAFAVLGVEPQLPGTVTVVADTPSGDEAFDLLVREGLVEYADDGLRLQIAHALIAAAVRQAMPPSTRRLMHRRASAAVLDPMQRFEHEVVAAERYDEGLASQLLAAAQAAHERSDFRRAATLRSWASTLSADPKQRSDRELDALFERVLARDVGEVRRLYPQLEWVGDRARSLVVQSCLLLFEKRYREADLLLAELPEDAMAATDPLTRYRVLILAAWARVATRPASADSETVGLLARASGQGVQDAAIETYRQFAEGQLATRAFGDAPAAVALAAPDLGPARDVPLSATPALAWRGSLRAFQGHSGEAEQDLDEVCARITAGEMDPNDGAFHALLAYARWQKGSWPLAEIDLDVAGKLAFGVTHPAVEAIAPLLPAGRGDVEEASERLARAEATMRDIQWPEVAHLLLVAEVAVADARGDTNEQRRCLRRINDVLGFPAITTGGYPGPVWHLHAAIALVWAADLRNAARQVERLSDEPAPRWANWATLWLKGRISAAGGDSVTALQRFEEASVAVTDEFPLYQAHLWTDLAGLGAPARRSSATATAFGLYQSVGARGFAGRLETANDAGEDVLVALSEREREVASLVVAGLSYAQVAKQLYLTRSTVGYHLSNIYAKTSVTSRHELTELVRSGSLSTR